MTGHEIDENHLAAGGLDDLASNDRLSVIIASLHQHFGPHALDQIERGVLVEDRDEIDRGFRRLSPEHRSPVALDDCLAALTWAVQEAELLGVDSSKVAVGGDSAGAWRHRHAGLVCRAPGAA